QGQAAASTDFRVRLVAEVFLVNDLGAGGAEGAGGVGRRGRVAQGRLGPSQLFVRRGRLVAGRHQRGGRLLPRGLQVFGVFLSLGCQRQAVQDLLRALGRAAAGCPALLGFGYRQASLGRNRRLGRFRPG